MSTTALTAPDHRDAERESLIAAGITVVLWASAFPGIRAGLESYGPENLALLRYLVASGVLVVYSVLTGARLPDLRDVPGLALFGFLGFSLYNVALNAGEVTVSAGVASFLIASEPIYIAVLALMIWGERFKGWGWAGIALSCIGVTVIALSTDDGLRVDWRALLILGAAVVKAVYSVGQRPYLEKYGALRFTTYAIWTGTFFLLVFTPGLIADARSATPEATLAIVYMGIFPGAIAYAGWSFILSRMPAAVAGSFLYLVPAFAVVIAWLWLGEVPPMIALVGGALVVVGVFVVNSRGRERVAKR